MGNPIPASLVLYKTILVLRERAGTTILVETMRKAETGEEGRENCCGPGISIHRKLTTPEDLCNLALLGLQRGVKPDEE